MLKVEEIGSSANYEAYVKRCMKTLGIIGEFPDWTICPVTQKRMRLNRLGLCVTTCQFNENPKYKPVDIKPV